MPIGPLEQPTDLVRRVGATSRAALFAVAGSASLLGFNLLQTLSLALIPFSRRGFRRFNHWCLATWGGWCVAAAERFNGTRLVVSGDPVPAAENALVIANHQQMPDINLLMAWAHGMGRLGELKFFVKSTLKHVPGIGWGMRFLSYLFVARDWAADRETIAKTFSRIVGERIPLWLVSFSEGTRLTPEKLERSRKLAARKGLRPTRHVLLPRPRGFVASVEGLGEHLDSVYDVTIGYVGGVPSLWQFLGGRVGRAHLHVRRFAVSELPERADELAEWLRERFREKDDLLEFFYERGFFPAARPPHGRLRA